MARTCPRCGSKAIDDQSQFCNKCGSPFPEDQPKKVLVRTTPRPADTPPPPQPQQSLQQPVEQPAPRQPAPPVYPKVRSPVHAPVREQRKPAPVLPFRKFFAKDWIKPVYWLGVIAIVLIVFAGISTGTTKSATTQAAAPDTTADTAKTPSGDILAGIPLFWIGVFIFANLFWRTVCEASAIQFAIHDSLAEAATARNTEHDFLFENGEPAYGETGTGSDEFVTCPRCGKVVPESDLRSCAHCGVEGCTSCIRMMGLVRKTLTCKDCYERKK